VASRWKTVSRAELCPACKHAAWCAWDGELLRCQRPSESSAPSGMVLVEEKAEYCLYRPEGISAGKRRASSSSRTPPPPESLTDQARAYRSQVSPASMAALAGELGVRADALQALGIGWCTRADLARLGASWTGARPDGAWAFPEFDGDGRVCGFSLRAADGRKSSPASKKTEARRGLVIPVDAELRPAAPDGKVLIVEGASDVAAVLSLGLVAVGRPSNASGAQDLAKLLAGREVLVLGENDAKPNGEWPGKEGADRVASELAKVWNKPVRRALPPDGAKDLREWLRARQRDGLLLEDAAACGIEGSRLLRCLEAISKEFEPSGSKLLLRNLADVQQTKVEWVWFEKIPAKKLSGISGDPNLGKSALTIEIAAHETRGAPWPDGSPCPLGSVLLLSAEDDAADTIKPRLVAAGGDAKRFWVIDGVIEENGKRTFFDLSRNADLLEQQLDEHEDIKLIMIDPLGAYLGATDENRNAQVRAVLGVLSELAARRGIAILFVMHLNKASEMKALYRGSGSVALTAAPRAFWLVANDKHDPDLRLLLPVKVNLVRQPKGIGFKLVDAGGVPRVEWSTEEVTVTADDVLKDGQSKGKAPSKLDAAMDWLCELLGRGPVPEQEVKRAAEEARHTWATVRRAKVELGVHSEKEGMRGSWVWSLPSAGSPEFEADEGAQGPEHPPMSTFGEDEHLRAEDHAEGGPDGNQGPSDPSVHEGAQPDASPSPEVPEDAQDLGDGDGRSPKELTPAEGAQPGSSEVEHLRGARVERPQVDRSTLSGSGAAEGAAHG
jgi:AAA domain